MKKPLSLALSNTSLVASFLFAAPAVQGQAPTAVVMEEVTITAIREDRKSRGATGLDLSLWETPQSLTIVDSDTIHDFGLTDINSLLQLTTGVNVDATETDRTYYNARGFDITSMHVDSIGIPFGNLIVGALDTAIYEKVEIIRGSNGLITGLGNPSGTINYVRKRPTNQRQGSIELSGGRWDFRRLEADVSTPLTDSGNWAARAVVAYQEKDSWLDHYRNDRQIGYLVVDGQLTDSLTLAVGYTHQDNNSDGVTWGAVPVLYSNGEQAHFDVSTSIAMDWTYWDTQTDEAFVELGWQINNHWRLTSTVMHTDYEEYSELFYVYTNTGFDQATGLGLESNPGKYDVEREDLILDANLNGRFRIWGREHQLQLGVSAANSDSVSFAHPAPADSFIAMPPFPGWSGNEVPRPAWQPAYRSAHEDIDLNRVYGSLLLAATDHLNLVLGLNKVDYNNDGESYGVSTDSDEDGTSPYIGFTWEVMQGLNTYASYSDIYQPQYVLGEDLQSLGSAEGESYEVGVKKSFSSGALVSLALFRTEQSNLQEFVAYDDGDGVDDTDFSDDFDYALYRGINVESEGVEVEVAGNLTDVLQLQAGITHLTLEDETGEEARTFIPRNTVKLLLSWNPVAMPKLALGASGRWQDETYYGPAGARITQEDYAVIGGFARYAVTPDLSVRLNLDNLTDEKYFSSVKYEQAYYAAPRNARLSVAWSF
ncbi:MAG: TonB-dependent siderophore receptor [Pseudomonadota bacterium]|nr:TonB-dependent siderophore receptor [Pseudomonadales bacterium]MDY6919210.1 TonB-dependent siderophore receptor [Pseudomonadota bacterium]